MLGSYNDTERHGEKINGHSQPDSRKLVDMMPNRLLKEGIVDSEKINALSPQAEVFFYRLLVVSDDFGRMDARPAILRARCFPLKEVTGDQISAWLHELETATGRDDFGLVICYESGGQPYLQILNWDQRQRSHAKYPEPPKTNMSATCAQPADICPPSAADGGVGLGLGLGLGLGSGSGKGLGKGLGETGRDKRASFDPAALDLPDGLSGPRWAEWIEYRRKRKLTVTEITMRKQLVMLSKWIARGHDVNAVIEASITNGWQGLFEPKNNSAQSSRAGKFDPVRYVNDKQYAAEWDAQKGGGHGRVIDIS
jgi:hypothetical protein